jgi:4-amino-4-deoxy-L-arabinose transferase-like glycosyltransferase
MEKLSEKKLIAGLFLFALLIRVGFILTLENHLYMEDEFEYIRMVNNFLAGRGLIVSETLKAFRPPLYPLLLSILKAFNLNLFGIRFVQCLISAATVILVYLTGKKIFNSRVGIFSAIISSVYPFFVFYNGFILTETVFIFLATAVIYSYVSLNNRKITWLRTGFILGLAGLCRPTIQGYLPFSFLLILSFHQPLRRKLGKIFFILIAFILTLSPWVIRNYKIFNKFIPGTTMGGYVFWEGNNPRSYGGPCHYFPESMYKIEETQRDKFLYRKTFDCIKEDPERFIYLLGHKFFRFWNVVPNAPEYSKSLYKIGSLASFGLLMPFFILGFIFSLKNKKAQYLHLLIILFTISHMIYLASIRYRVAIEPFYIILAVYGFIQLTGFRAARGGNPVGKGRK